MSGSVKGRVGAVGAVLLAAVAGCRIYEEPLGYPQPQPGYQPGYQQPGYLQSPSGGAPPASGGPGWYGAPPPGGGAVGAGETIQVPAGQAEPVWTNQPLAAGVDYVMEASGVWSAWGDRRDGVDALYGYAQWRVGNTPELWNQLLLDDRPMGDIAKQNGQSVAYNPAHVYTTTLRGTGQRVKLQIVDAKNGSWSDNHGGLTVVIYPRGGAPVAGYPPAAPPAAPPMSMGETVVVAADRADAVWTPVLAPGVLYVVEASGVWSAWGDKMDGIDAYYCYADWRVGPTPQLWNQLQLDDRAMADIAKQNGDSTGYNPSHTYVTTVRGTGQRVKLQLLDSKNGSWSDNHGAVQVRVYPR
ncbi:MAG TPA: hypothetical protein VFH73_26505 [Polyangia bacterium]|nr:hypothetical protein [Polyangia bacterium]